VRFERIDTVGGQHLPSTNVMSLLAPRSGGLWVGYRFGGASFIEGGKVTNYGPREGLPGGTVTRMVQDHAGVIWANTGRGLKRFDGSLWEDAGETFNLPSEFVRTLSVARDGTLWIVVGRTLMFLHPGQTVFSATDVQTSEEEADFIETPDGTLWLTDAALGAHAVDGKNWIALRDPQHGPVAGARGQAQGREHEVRDRALCALQGPGGRAGDDVLPRSLGQRARVQGVRRFVAGLRQVKPGTYPEFTG